MDARLASPATPRVAAEPLYPRMPYLGFEAPVTNVSIDRLSNLNKLAALLAIIVAFGPLEMAAYGAWFGTGAT